MNKKMILLLVVMILAVFMLSGCVPGSSSYNTERPAGFFSGVWHGWIAPVTLIIGFFNRNIRIYECVNTGWFYDLGFYIAIISGFGGISLVRKKSSYKR